MTRGPAASKVALVTGATRGIGRAIALELARHNFAVVVTGRTLAEGQGVAPGSIEGVVSAIHEGGGAALGVRLDLLDRSSIEAAMAATMDRFGRLDVLVNNGIYQGPEMMLPVADFSMTAAEDNFRGMVVNQIYASRLAIAAMRRQGQGRLVFMGSLARPARRTATQGCSTPPARRPSIASRPTSTTSTPRTASSPSWSSRSSP